MLTAEEYLARRFAIPTILPTLPLASEKFLRHWRAARGVGAIEFLSRLYGRELAFDWRAADEITITFTTTLAGRLPVIETVNHDDFAAMATFLRGKPIEISDDINAFTISVRIRDEHHRLILLNRAFYSGVACERVGLTAEQWLEISRRLRLRHEAAHYEMLRIFGDMQNHAFDEIVADTLGQIAAFGNFSAARQRLFFGLRGDECTGRLRFYCRKIFPDERKKIYGLIDGILDEIEREVVGKSEVEILSAVAHSCHSNSMPPM